MAIALSNCDAEDSTAWPPATPLLTAIAHGHTDVARLLLAARADPNAAAPTGADAAEPEGDQGGVSVRLHHGFLSVAAVVHSWCLHGQALLLASQRSEVGMVTALLEAGADPAAPTAATNHGASPLYVACQRAHYTIAEALLDAGAPTDRVYRNARGVPFTVRDIAAYARPRNLLLLEMLDLAGGDAPRLVGAEQRLALAKLTHKRLAERPSITGLLLPALVDPVGQAPVLRRGRLEVCRRHAAQAEARRAIDAAIGRAVATVPSVEAAESVAEASAALLFESHDRNRDGGLDRQEMQTVLQDMAWLEPGEALTRAEWERLCEVLWSCEPVFGPSRSEFVAWILAAQDTKQIEARRAAYREAIGPERDEPPVPWTPPAAVEPSPAKGAADTASDGARERSLLAYWSEHDPAGLRQEIVARRG